MHFVARIFQKIVQELFFQKKNTGSEFPDDGGNKHLWNTGKPFWNTQSNIPEDKLSSNSFVFQVRKMVRWSASPDTLSQVSVPSFTGSSTTPELLEEEEQVAQEKMQGNCSVVFILHSYKH